MDAIWIRYLTLPELSVEGFQANVTLVGVMAVVCRLVGVVGALRSLAAKTGEGLYLVQQVMVEHQQRLLEQITQASVVA